MARGMSPKWLQHGDREPCGPRGYMENKPGVAKDFERAASEAAYRPEFLKKVVTHRLMSSVIEGKPSNVAREAELLGKMKRWTCLSAIPMCRSGFSRL